MFLIRVEIEVRAPDVALPPAETASRNVSLESAIVDQRISRVGRRGTWIHVNSLAPDCSGILEFFLGNQHIREHVSPLPIRVRIFCDQTMPDLERSRRVLRINQKGERLRICRSSVGQNLIEQQVDIRVAMPYARYRQGNQIGDRKSVV